MIPLGGGRTMIHVNMFSKADSVKGQGVGSAYLEQVALVKEELSQDISVTINKLGTKEVTHYHSINPEFFFTIPFAKRKGTAVGYVHFIPETLEESIHLPNFCKRPFYWYVMKFYKSMDMLVTVNPCFIKKLEAYGIDSNKVTYIPNYVSSKTFHPITTCNKEDLKTQYGLDPSKFTVLGVGQLQIRKGILDFVEVAKQMPELQFVWAGGFSFGMITDGYEEIKKITEHPPSNVTFLGIIEREKMNELYNLADVMFLPSFNELFPMTVLESMNCNIPMLLRDLDLYEDILFDFYLKGNSVDEFVSLLERLHNDKNFHRKAIEMSKKGKEFYSREHVASMWKEFYHRAYNHKPPKIKTKSGLKIGPRTNF